MELTLDVTQAHFLKEWTKEGKSELWIAKKLGLSIDKVIFAKRALCPGGPRDTAVNVTGETGIGSRSAHGTPGKYNAGCRCPKCRKANTERCKVAKAVRLADADRIPHGTMTGYWNWNCRCDDCKKIGSEVNKFRNTTEPGTYPRKGERWVNPEQKTVTNYDQTARELALELGRTISGVAGRRSLINRGLVEL